MVNQEKLLLVATIYTLLPGAMSDADGSSMSGTSKSNGSQRSNPPSTMKEDTASADESTSEQA